VVNFNQSIHASPLTTPVMDTIERMHKNNRWVMSRLIAFGSFIPIYIDAKLVHSPLAVLKTIVAVNFKIAELTLSFFGKRTNLNDKCLSHFTGNEAANHYGKALVSSGLVMTVGLLTGPFFPMLTVKASRILGTSRTPLSQA
jgi:hypothetical protein